MPGTPSCSGSTGWISGDQRRNPRLLGWSRDGPSVQTCLDGIRPAIQVIAGQISAEGLVEAAGVEPASERPVAAGLYVRSRALDFAAGVKARRNRRPLVRLNLTGAHRTDAPTSLLNGVHSRPAG
jgi:hypothetical protein